MTSKPLVLRTTLGRWGHVDHKTCLTERDEEPEELKQHSAVGRVSLELTPKPTLDSLEAVSKETLAYCSDLYQMDLCRDTEARRHVREGTRWKPLSKLGSQGYGDWGWKKFQCSSAGWQLQNTGSKLSANMKKLRAGRASVEAVSPKPSAWEPREKPIQVQSHRCWRAGSSANQGQGKNSVPALEGRHTYCPLPAAVLLGSRGQSDCTLIHTTTESRVSPPCLLRLTHQSPQETPKQLYLGSSPTWTRGPKPPPTYSSHIHTRSVHSLLIPFLQISASEWSKWTVFYTLPSCLTIHLLNKIDSPPAPVRHRGSTGDREARSTGPFQTHRNVGLQMCTALPSPDCKWSVVDGHLFPHRGVASRYKGLFVNVSSPQMWQLPCTSCEEQDLGMTFTIPHTHPSLDHGKNASPWSKLYLSNFVLITLSTTLFFFYIISLKKRLTTFQSLRQSNRHDSVFI